MTCRFCGVQDPKAGKLVKYAARHWAHHHCWMETKGKELADPSDLEQVVTLLANAFHGWQLRQFPVFVIAEWVERKKVRAAGKSWVDKTMNLLKAAIERSEAPSRKVEVAR